VLRQRPNEFDALHMLGLIEYQRGRLPESLKLIGAAVKSNPNSADAWSNLGLAFHAQGDYAKAVGSFDRALAIKPDHADVLNNRGTTLNCLGRHEEALEAFARALALRSDYLFRALQPRLDAAQARTLCRGACKLRDRAGNRAEPFRYVMSSRQCAVEARPHRGRVCELRAGAPLRAGSPAYAAQPRDGAAPSRPARDALASAEKALRAMPDYASARFEQAPALVALGDFARGITLYESRWNIPEFEPQKRNFSGPPWLGEEDIAGKTLLVHAERGFGDTLHFVRYVPLLAERGAKVILEVQSQLKALLSQTAGASAVIGRGEPLPPFDRHCPLLSLPLAFRTQPETIPANVPYIAADRGACSRIGRRGCRTLRAKPKSAWCGPAIQAPAPSMRGAA
jgi:hypothetical protein